MMFLLQDASRVIRFDYTGVDFEWLSYVLLLVGLLIWLSCGVLQVVRVYVKP